MLKVMRRFFNEFKTPVAVEITDDQTEDVNFEMRTPHSKSTHLWTRQEAIAIRDALNELLPAEHFKLKDPR